MSTRQLRFWAFIVCLAFVGLLVGCSKTSEPSGPIGDKSEGAASAEDTTAEKAEESEDQKAESQQEREADAIGSKDADNSKQDEEAESSEDTEQAPEKPAFETLEVGETKSTDDFELTIESAEWTDEVYPDTSQAAGSYMYFADEEGSSYYLVKFSFHNLMGSFYEFQDTPATYQVVYIFNDKYQFPTKIYDPEVTGLFTSAICYSCEPLATNTYYVIASISDEIRNSMDSGKLAIQLKKIQLTDAEHYQVTNDYLLQCIVPLPA